MNSDDKKRETTQVKFDRMQSRLEKLIRDAEELESNFCQCGEVEGLAQMNEVISALRAAKASGARVSTPDVIPTFGGK